MWNNEPVSPRRSVLQELWDSAFFGALDPQSPYTEGDSVAFYCAVNRVNVRVKTPNQIAISHGNRIDKFRNTSDARSFLVRNFINQ